MNRSRLILGAALVIGVFIGATLTLRMQLSASRAPLQDAIKVGFRVGERAPDFELRSPDGSTVKLSALRGKPVLLNFWATWCTPCRVEMPWLVELDKKYGTQGLQIVGVSLDDTGAAQEVAAFAKQRGVKYQILSGDSSTANAYGGVRFMPQSFFIDPDGKILKTTTGLTYKRDLEDAAEALLKTIAESEAPSLSLKTGEQIPQFSATDQLRRRQNFDSLNAQTGLCEKASKPVRYRESLISQSSVVL